MDLSVIGDTGPRVTFKGQAGIGPSEVEVSVM